MYSESNYKIAGDVPVMGSDAPELQRVVERLGKAVEMYTELQYGISSKLSMISNIPGESLQKGESPNMLAPTTVIDNLHELLYSLERQNDGLSVSLNHLKRLV